MYVPLIVAFGVIALFAFPATAVVASKLIKNQFTESRPEPPRPNKTGRNIPGSKSGKSD